MGVGKMNGGHTGLSLSTRHRWESGRLRVRASGRPEEMTLEGGGRHLELSFRSPLLQAAFPTLTAPEERGKAAEVEQEEGRHRGQASFLQAPSPRVLYARQNQCLFLTCTPDSPHHPQSQLHPSPASSWAVTQGPRPVRPSYVSTACGLQRLSPGLLLPRVGGRRAGRQAWPNHAVWVTAEERCGEQRAESHPHTHCDGRKGVTKARLPRAERVQIQGKEWLPGPQSVIAHCRERT